MKQQTQRIQLHKELYHIYPDIEGELCTRHSTLFQKLHQSFNKLYDNMQPSHYVICKGSCELVEEIFTEVNLSMALQNGVICLVSKTYPVSQIFVNCNHFSEQVIFSHNGNLLQGLNILSEQMSRIIKHLSSTFKQPQGGIFYIYSNIPQNYFNYKQAFLISFYLSVLTINDNVENYTIDELVQRMVELQFIGTPREIRNQLAAYRNRKLNLQIPQLLSNNNSLSQNRMEVENKVEPDIETMIEIAENTTVNQNGHYNDNRTNKIIESATQRRQFHVDLDKDYKLLFCKLQVAREDVEYQITRRKDFSYRKQQLLSESKHNYGVDSLFGLYSQQIDVTKLEFTSLYEKQELPSSMGELQCCDQQQNDILDHPNQLLSSLLNQIQLVSQFSDSKITVEQLIASIWHINSQLLKLHSQAVVELVQIMKSTLELKACMIVNKDFLMIAVHKNKFSELLCQVKHMMNKGELKSKSLFRIEDDELVVDRWASDQAIGEKLFSSVPSLGVGVFDPHEAIWFD